MNWIYHIKREWKPNGESHAQELLVRGIIKDENGEESVAKIIEMNVFAMNFFFDLPKNPFEGNKYQQIFYEELAKKDYFIEELEIHEKQDYMLKRIALYLKDRQFDKEYLLGWVKTCLAIWGFPNDDLEERDIMAFSETDPMLAMFSMGNVKKFEDKLGKEWWKDNDKNKDSDK